MSALRDQPHHPTCVQAPLPGGLTAYLCSGDCPAMLAHLIQPNHVSGEVDLQLELSPEQSAALGAAVARHPGAPC